MLHIKTMNQYIETRYRNKMFKQDIKTTLKQATETTLKQCIETRY